MVTGALSIFGSWVIENVLPTTKSNRVNEEFKTEIEVKDNKNVIVNETIEASPIVLCGLSLLAILVVILGIFSIYYCCCKKRRIVERGVEQVELRQIKVEARPRAEPI